MNFDCKAEHVTGEVWVLALAAGQGSWHTLFWARVGGALAWVVAAGFLGLRAGNLPRLGQAVVVVSVLSCLPLAAWAVSGMETPWVVLLGVLALGESRWAALAAGLAAAWRPELVPWALVLSLAASAEPTWTRWRPR